MIVSLDELKAVLGIDPTNTDEDDYLLRLIAAKTAWVENYTQRRFDAPILHEEIKRGSGEAHLYLTWKVDDTPVTDPTPAPYDSVHVFRRAVAQRDLGWEELIEDVDWERFGQKLTFLKMWGVWPECDEYLLQYLGGYTVPPEDIREVVLEMASNQYLVNQTTSTGTGGVTGEKIGDYDYTQDLSVTVTSGGSDSLGEGALRTLARYKRRLA